MRGGEDLYSMAVERSLSLTMWLHHFNFLFLTVAMRSSNGLWSDDTSYLHHMWCHLHRRYPSWFFEHLISNTWVFRNSLTVNVQDLEILRRPIHVTTLIKDLFCLPDGSFFFNNCHCLCCSIEIIVGISNEPSPAQVKLCWSFSLLICEDHLLFRFLTTYAN